jgi:hypothetical protein
MNKIKPHNKILTLDPRIVARHGLNENQAKFLSYYMASGLKDALNAYRKAYDNDNPNERTIRPYASKILNQDKIQACLAEHIKIANFVGDREIVSTEEVLEVLKEILHKDDAENKDRIKAGEILLKHLNAFKEHNQAKAPKSLTITTNKSTEELISDIKQLSGDLTQTPILETTNLSEIIDEDDDEEDADYEEI